MVSSCIDVRWHYTARRRLRVMLIALPLMFHALAGSVSAQVGDIRVSGAAKCEDCRIELEHVVTIGSPDDEHLYDQFSALTRGPGPFYFVANSFTPGVVLVYDSTGTYKNAIGRQGSGPGEIAGNANISVTPEDSLYVANQGRTTIFSLPGGVATRSWNHGVNVWSVSTLKDGISAATLAPNSALETVRIFNADGSRRASIYFEGTLQHHEQLPQRTHSAGDTLLLVSDVGRYRFRAFDLDGHPRWTFEREVEWFQPYSRQPQGALISVPSLPNVVGAWVQSDRFLWVLLERAAANWRPLEGGLERGKEGDFNTVFGSHLEVIDLHTGQVVASRRTNWLIPVAEAEGQPYVRTVHTSDVGHYVFDVWRVKLINHGKGGDR